MIRIDDLRFSFDDGEFHLAIDQLEIAAGEHVACIGPSGTGKTTLVNLLAGILVPGSGTVRVGEHVVSALSDAERRRVRISEIGLVFQEFELLAYMTAWENILLPYRVAPHLEMSQEVRERARHLADAMGLSETLNRLPRRLSHGERQRVAICRALVTGPRLVMCDEPTGNLDPETARTTLDLLFEQVGHQKATLLMVTHNYDILERFDRTLDMRDLT